MMLCVVQPVHAIEVLCYIPLGASWKMCVLKVVLYSAIHLYMTCIVRVIGCGCLRVCVCAS